MLPTARLLVLAAALMHPAWTASAQTEDDRVELYPSDVVELPGGRLLVLQGVVGAREPQAADALLVDPASGETLEVFAEAPTGMLYGAVNPAGTALATWPHDGAVWIRPWSADAKDSAAEVRLPLPEHDHWGTQRCRWSHDGAHLITWFAEFFHTEPTINTQLWSRSGELLWTGPPVSQVDLHPARNLLAAVGPGFLLTGWPAEDGKRGITRTSLPGAHGAAQFSPDGQRTAVGGTGPAGTDQTYDPKRGAKSPWLWILDAESREVQLTTAVKGVDLMGVKKWLNRLRWSPDGSLLGVSLGKGHAVGAISAADGSVVWTGDFQGGRMWEVFDVGWTDTGRLQTGFGDTRLIDPRDPKGAIHIGQFVDARVVNLDGTDDVIVFLGLTIARLDPVTGERRWER